MLKEYLSTLANAIRSKLGSTSKINAQDFAVKIDEVYKAGQFKTLQDSEYMNAKVSGTAIAVNDVNSIEHSVGCRVASKNLLNVGNRTIRRMGSNQLNFVENSIYTDIARNGVYVHTNVTHDISNPQQIMVNSNSNAFGLAFNFKVKPNETYTVNCSNFDNSKQSIGIGFFTEGGALISHFAIGEYPNTTVPKTFSTPANSYWLLVVLTVTSSATNQNIIFENVQLELGTTATPYTPYVADVGGIEVSRYGKNLFDIDTVLPSLINNYGDAGKWIKQSDGSYFKGNVGTGYGDIWFENKANYKGQIAISMASKHTITEVGVFGLTLEIEYTDGTKKTAIHTPMLSETYSVRTFVTDANKTVFRITQSYNSGKGMYVKDVMIAYGSDTSYEPYIEPTTYQSTADGTVEGVTSISPNMTLLSNNNGVVINANYLRDIDTYIDNLITNVALTGGE